MTDVFLRETELRAGRIQELQELGVECQELNRPALDPRGMISLPS